jgi:leader peptidase (prepilin peptidase)/N-methyltransferase
VTAVVAVACAAVGVAAGPALALLADRVPERKPLRGDGWRTPHMVLITIATAILFGAVGARFGADWAVPAYLVFTGCLIVVTVTDLRLFLIPNRIIYPTLGASVVLLSAAAALGHDGEAWRRAVIGGVAAWVALLIVHLINPRGMAFGDVRLAAVIGVYTGWLGYNHVFLGLFLGFLAGAVVGVLLIVTRRRGAKDPVPFGPFLAFGAMTAVLVGKPLLDWYTGS